MLAEEVTNRHGAIFMQCLLHEATRGGVFYNAYALAGLVEWPDEQSDYTPAKRRYESIEEEILRRTLFEVEGKIAEAFVAAAREVIERERRRQREG